MSTGTSNIVKNPREFSRKYAAEIRRAIDSADVPYEPGAMDRAFHQVPRHQRESVNQETNRIFQQRTGVRRSLNQSKEDEKLRRQWLRIRDVVMSRRFDLYGKKTDIRHRWAIYQVNLGQNMFEIDIENREKDAPVIQPHVTHLIFSKGTVPAGFNLTMESRSGFDRWRVTWKSTVNLAASLNWQFVNAIMFPQSFGSEWRAKSQRDRVIRQKEVLRQIRVLNTPNKQLGGRTPAEVMKLPEGNYEVKGQGFITVWKDYIYFQSLSSHEDTNEAIRWFLRRRVSLPMAISINSRQQSGLYKEALAASFLTLRGGFKLRPNGGPSPSLLKQAKKFGEMGIKKSLSELESDQQKAVNGKSGIMSIVREKVKTRTEREAQSDVDRLANVRPGVLKVLRPI